MNASHQINLDHTDNTTHPHTSVSKVKGERGRAQVGIRPAISQRWSMINCWTLGRRQKCVSRSGLLGYHQAPQTTPKRSHRLRVEVVSLPLLRVNREDGTNTLKDLFANPDNSLSTPQLHTHPIYSDRTYKCFAV